MTARSSTPTRPPRRPPPRRPADDAPPAPPTPPAAPAAPVEDVAGKTVRSLPVRLARRISAVVGFVATLLGLLFVLFPALKPEEAPREKGARLTNPTVELLSFGQYLDRTDVARTGFDAAALRRRGIVVEFDFVIDGYKNRPLQLRYGLIDARTGDQLDKSRDTRFTPQAWTDRGSHPVWIPQPRRRAARVYVQLQLISDDSDAAIGRVRTPVFRAAELRSS